MYTYISGVVFAADSSPYRTWGTVSTFSRGSDKLGKKIKREVKLCVR